MLKQTKANIANKANIESGGSPAAVGSSGPILRSTPRSSPPGSTGQEHCQKHCSRSSTRSCDKLVMLCVKVEEVLAGGTC